MTGELEGSTRRTSALARAKGKNKGSSSTPYGKGGYPQAFGFEHAYPNDHCYYSFHLEHAAPENQVKITNQFELLLESENSEPEAACEPELVDTLEVTSGMASPKEAIRRESKKKMPKPRGPWSTVQVDSSCTVRESFAHQKDAETHKHLRGQWKPVDEPSTNDHCTDVHYLETSEDDGNGDIQHISEAEMVWVEVQSIMDTGAAESVVPLSLGSDLPIRETEASRRGSQFQTAAGTKIANQGARSICENGCLEGH